MMKKSVSLSLFEGSKTAPILFRSDIEKNIPLIKELGYDGVDLFVLDPSSEISRKAKQLLKDKGLGVGSVMPASLAAEGLFLGDNDSAIRQEIVERMKEIIAYAAEVGGMVSLGLVRGSVKGNDTVPAFLDRFKDSIEKLLPFSQRHGVELLLEPINRYETNAINSSLEGYEFIAETGLPIGLLLDTFHMNIEDVDIHESFKTCGDLVKHVHFLDSNRLAPGMGHLDMKDIYATLQRMDYAGYLCLESLQGEDYQAVAQKGINFFNSVQA